MKYFGVGMEFVIAGEKRKMFKSGYDPEEVLKMLTSTSVSDVDIIAVLRICGVEWADIFSLVWGHMIAKRVGFPQSLKNIVDDVVREEAKKEESLDIQDRKIHDIIIELSGVMYKRQVEDLVERVEENEKMKRRRYDSQSR